MCKKHEIMSERIVHVIPNLQMKKYERKAVGISRFIGVFRMNDMIHFELQNREIGILSGNHALFLPFNPRFCVIQSQNMQK